MNYGVLGVIRLALDFIGTKIAFRKSRLIRFPIDIRGRSFIDFGSNLTTGRYCRLEVYPIEHKKGILKVLGRTIIIPVFGELFLLSIIAITRIPVGRYTPVLVIAMYITSIMMVIRENEK